MFWHGRARVRSAFVDRVKALHSLPSKPPRTQPAWLAITAFAPWMSVSAVRVRVVHQPCARWRRLESKCCPLKTPRRFRTMAVGRRNDAEFSFGCHYYCLVILRFAQDDKLRFEFGSGTKGEAKPVNRSSN